MSLSVTLLGTGSPMPSPDRAGPATLISAGDGDDAEHYLVDAGRGVLMRLAALGLGAPNLTAVLITHLHSDHITDLNDVITTRWVMTFTETPLTIVGPVGTQAVVDHLLASLDPDIEYRIAHHEDLDHRPPVTVIEVTDGAIELPSGQGGGVTISCGQTDHKPVEPSVGFRFGREGASVVVAGDTVPCDGLDALCAGADALVHTAIRKDIIANVPVPRMQDTLDYHSSPEQAAQTAAKAGLATLILTHYVPPMPISGTEDDWRTLAAEHFAGTIELGDDLHRVEIHPR
ncbi:ribonuclease Z [Ilumatobacter nonamiensis]|uniref:ribonuclease Z n=1 Tax=Ilumatobacter nonamiensis TaxID=467093 RepID=UPI00058CBC25|nr:ribonuclease Z [Ilumatobacter nonamiensis]